MSQQMRLRPLPLMRNPVAPPLGAGQVVQAAFNVDAYRHGRIRGTVHVSTAGVLLVEFGEDGVDWSSTFDVPQDPTMPDFQYPFEIFVLQPHVRITFTDGGAGSAIFRADVTALPF